jgi:hypothetical protein
VVAKKVYQQFPTLAELASLPQIALVDQVTPAQTLGAGTGTVLIVGETERGEFTPTQIFSDSDYVSRYGGFGHATSSGKYSGPVALRSGGTEYWNGNLHVWRTSLSFAALVVCRVDNSAGSVQFRRLAAKKGGKGTFDLAAGDTVTWRRNDAVNVPATFLANKAVINATSGTFPTLFTGGETLLLTVDGVVLPPIVFTDQEQTEAECIARINLAAALTIAFDNGGEISLRSMIAGSSGRIEITGGTAVATLGFVSVAVADVWDWVAVNAQAGNYTLRIAMYVAGVLTNFDATFAQPDGVEATLRNGLLAAFAALTTPPPGVTIISAGAAGIKATGAANVLFTASVFAEVSPGDISITHTTTGKVTLDAGDGNVADIDAVTAAEAASIFEALSGIGSYVDSKGFLWVTENSTPATGKLQAVGGVYEALGFDAVKAEAAAGAEVTIPAGTRVQDSTTSTVWVTLQDILTDKAGGPFDAKVRPWVDNDTALGSASSGVDVIIDRNLPDAFAVTNSAAIARLSTGALDIRYRDAMIRTLGKNGPGANANIIVSARSSANIGAFLRDNAIAATAAGLICRKTIYGPPIGTTRAVAKGDVGVGVGNVGRHDRLTYCFPGHKTLIPEILEVGVSGGQGFSDTGVVQRHSDGIMAMIRSKIPPERSAGEAQKYTNVGSLTMIIALEDAYDPNVGGVDLVDADYVDFQAKGIAALRFSKPNGWEIESDVSSVDPTSDKARSDNNRRYFADFLIDTAYSVAAPYKDRLNTPRERQSLEDQLNGFLDTLQAPGQPEQSRLERYGVHYDSTPAQTSAGLPIFALDAKMYGLMKAIVLLINAGPNVTITEKE